MFPSWKMTEPGPLLGVLVEVAWACAFPRTEGEMSMPVTEPE